jgi:superfamily II DNA or RNA helicase
VYPLWPHQQFGIESVTQAVARFVRRLLLVSPTGMGKSRTVCEIITRLAEEGWYVVLFTNRKLLLDQLKTVLEDHGIHYGVRAANHELEPWPVQISSLPTEISRVLRGKEWQIHGLGRECLIIVDEAHLNFGPEARKLYAMHHEAGHYLLGVTATPLDLEGCFDEMIQAGTVSEGRACGALVEARHYGPDEPDLKGIKGLSEGQELTEKQAAAAIMREGLFGRVWENFEKLNPDHKPTILFAPGVEQSIWFAEQFTKQGVPAAHMDGQHIWVEGELHPTSDSLRREILDASRDGTIGVLTNRFVLREGIDCPWLAHGIFATIFGSLQTYLQSGGRLLRSHPSLGHVTIQDHGGNWWRHGSLNADRTWKLDMTAAMAYGLRADKLRSKKCEVCGTILANGPVCVCGHSNEPEPFLCPNCGRAWGAGTKCSQSRGGCGYTLTSGKRSRPVVSRAGTLVEMKGDIFKPRRISKNPNGPKLWERMYHRSCTEKGRRSFRAAAALFARENYFAYPDPTWPLMPIDPLDWFFDVPKVPKERLTRA